MLARWVEVQSNGYSRSSAMIDTLMQAADTVIGVSGGCFLTRQNNYLILKHPPDFYNCSKFNRYSV